MISPLYSTSPKLVMQYIASGAGVPFSVEVMHRKEDERGRKMTKILLAMFLSCAAEEWQHQHCLYSDFVKQNEFRFVKKF